MFCLSLMLRNSWRNGLIWDCSAAMASDNSSALVLSCSGVIGFPVSIFMGDADGIAFAFPNIPQRDSSFAVMGDAGLLDD